MGEHERELGVWHRLVVWVVAMTVWLLAVVGLGAVVVWELLRVS